MSSFWRIELFADRILAGYSLPANIAEPDECLALDAILSSITRRGVSPRHD